MRRIEAATVVWLTLCLGLGAAAQLEPGLARRLAVNDKPDQKFPVSFYLTAQAGAADFEASIEKLPRAQRRARVGRILADYARLTQQDLMSWLTTQQGAGKVEDLKSLWIVNAIGCWATRDVIAEVAVRPDIALVYSDAIPVERGTVEMTMPPVPSDGIGGHMAVTNVRGAWRQGAHGEGVVVGVIDSGIRRTHLDLCNRLWTSTVYPSCGFNFASFEYSSGRPGPSPYDTLTPEDYNGHGTHCSGIVAADGSYGNGVHDTLGLAPAARVMALPVDIWIHSPYPDTSLENNILAAMQFCIRPPRDTLNGADVILLPMRFVASWLPRYAVWRQVEENVLRAGLVHCAEAGNEGPYSGTIGMPGNCPPPWRNPVNHPLHPGDTARTAVITVGATDSSDVIASFSSQGPTTVWGTIAPWNDYEDPPGLLDPDVCMPGVNIRSTSYDRDSTYVTWSGDASATSGAAGVVALMLSQNPAATPKQIDSVLELYGVRDLGTPGKDNTYGAGRINCSLAVAFTPPPPPDVGCTRLMAPHGIIDSIQNLTPACSVYNYGDASVTYIVRVRVESVYDCTTTVTDHNPLTKRYVTFPAGQNWPRGSHVVSCSTELSGDGAPANDRQNDSILVVVRDAGIRAVPRPTAAEAPGAVPVNIRVKNYGSLPTDFRVRAIITDAVGTEIYNDLRDYTALAAGDSLLAMLVTWVAPSGIFAFKAKVTATGDMCPANDSLIRTVTVGGSGVWERMADVPAGPKSKSVKDGGCLAAFAGPWARGSGNSPECGVENVKCPESPTRHSFDPRPLTSDSGIGYALKGNNRYEFYRYNGINNVWTPLESIPAIGSSGRKKAVKKGACMAGCASEGLGWPIYASKGNSTVEWWQYRSGFGWTEKASIPTGVKTVKEGAGAAYVPDSAGQVYFLKGSGTTEFYRYDIATNTWATMTAAPLGPSGKTYKNGSCITYDYDLGTIYALKGSYNEFFSYHISSNTWMENTPLPLIGGSGKKKKAKDGAGLAYCNGVVCCQKGGNTREFWTYRVASGFWNQSDDLPVGAGKNAKGGGGLTCSYRASGQAPAIYALKGNNTLEFYKHGATASDLPLTTGGPPLNVQTNSEQAAAELKLATPNAKLRITPNPFTSTTMIEYTLPEAGNVTLKLHDVTGQLVQVLARGYHSAGVSSFGLRTPGLRDGIYLLRLETETGTTTSKLIIE
jgi:serine protease AprX